MLGAPAHVFSQKAVAVTGVSITVEDLDREVSFFTQTLDFREIKREKWSGPEVAALFGLSEAGVSVEMVDLQLGTETIRLMDFDGVPSRSMPADTRSNDLWFQHLAIVVTDMDSAYQKLLSAGVTHVSTAPQTLPDYLPNAAGIKAFYFRDPEGHNLELIWFPPDNGGRPTVDGGRPTVDGKRLTRDGVNEGGESIIAPDNEQGDMKNKQPGMDNARKTVPANDLSNTVSRKPSAVNRLPSAVNRKPSTVNRRPSTVFLGIDHTAIGISDTERSMTFYRDRLGLAHGGHS
ncbi:MAG: VOC family protein, partial [Saprospiraceae bacterium]|nr:VOC family protein [Saprospiraceae bacterium]